MKYGYSMKHLFLQKGQNTEKLSKYFNLGRKVIIVKGVENRVVRTKTQAKITNLKQTAKSTHATTCGKTKKNDDKDRFS